MQKPNNDVTFYAKVPLISFRLPRSPLTVTTTFRFVRSSMCPVCGRARRKGLSAAQPHEWKQQGTKMRGKKEDRSTNTQLLSRYKM